MALVLTYAHLIWFAVVWVALPSYRRTAAIVWTAAAIYAWLLPSPPTAGCYYLYRAVIDAATLAAVVRFGTAGWRAQSILLLGFVAIHVWSAFEYYASFRFALADGGYLWKNTTYVLNALQIIVTGPGVIHERYRRLAKNTGRMGPGFHFAWARGHGDGAWGTEDHGGKSAC